MSEKLNLHQKLIQVRKTVPSLQKDASNHQNSYVSGSNVLSNVIVKMNELQVLLIPNIEEFQFTEVAGKPTVICKLKMSWVDAENPTDKIDVPFACFGTQSDISKAFGSALTYSERYFLLKFFNIATDKDDPDAAKNKGKPSENGEICSMQQKSKLKAKIGDAEFAKAMNDNKGKLPVSVYNELMQGAEKAAC